MIPILSNLKLL